MMLVHIPAHGLVRTTIKVPSPIEKGDVIPRSWLALPRTKAAAIARNLPWYFTGDACPAGHVSIRRVTSSACPACAREDGRRRYQIRKEVPDGGRVLQDR